MPVIATDLVNFATPGLWAHVRAASDDGGLPGLDGRDGDLESHGLHRDQAFVTDLVDWYRAGVPVTVAFCLWYLRRVQDVDGAVCRSRIDPVVETNPVVRFIHLARLVGEDDRSDPAVELAANWVVEHQLADGSLPTTPVERDGEAGTTARAARALHGLGPKHHLAVERMWAALAAGADRQGDLASWGAGTGRRRATAATGATGLAVVALVDAGPEHHDLLRAAGRWLLAAQQDDGGWAELLGGPSTSHNTFNALRAVLALARHGLIDGADSGDAQRGVRRWVDGKGDSLLDGRAMDAGFGVRLLALLGRTDRRAEELARRFAGRASEVLGPASDAYDTEVVGLALLEWSRVADGEVAAAGSATVAAPWRWELPRLLPPFARGGNDLYDVLYQLRDSTRWRSAIDRVVRRNLVEAAGGRILGVVGALAIVDERSARYLAGQGNTAVAVLLVVAVVAAAAAWVAMRLLAATARARVLRSLATSVALGALVADMDLLGIPAGALDPVVVRLGLTTLTALVVDVVSYTADRSGLVARFLPSD